MEKQKNSGKKILAIGLRASNLVSSSSADHFDGSFMDSDEDFLPEMGSTGPIGEKKKKLMSEILEATNPQIDPLREGYQSRNLDNSQKFSSARVSWAEEVELVDVSSRSFSSIHPSDDLKITEVSGNTPVNSALNSSIPSSNLKIDEVSGSEPLISDLDSVLVKNLPTGNLDKSNVNPNCDKIASSFVNPNPVHVNKDTKKSWVNLFADNRKTGSGLNLGFIPPDSNNSVIFDDDEWNEGSSIWEFSLIGRVLGLNASFKAMENFIQKVWLNLTIPEICLLRAGLFLFKFRNKEEMNEVLANGPWFFGSRPLLLKPWTIGDDFDKIDSCSYPMWIQFPALRLNLWNSKCISKISSIIGRPITTDKLTANRQRLAYARVLIEVDLPATLPDQITIQSPNGKQYQQRVIYEMKPRWCDFCKSVGHDALHCRRQVKSQKWVPKQKTVVSEKTVVSQMNQNQVGKKYTQANEADLNVVKGKSVVHSPGNEALQTGDCSSLSVHAVHVSDISGMEAVQVIHASTPNVEFQQAPKSNSNYGTFTCNVSDVVLHPMHSFSGNMHMENPWKQVQRNVKINTTIEALQAGDCSMMHASTPIIELQQVSPKYGVHVPDSRTIPVHTFSETKIKENILPGVTKKLACNWKWYANGSSTDKARILILWDPNVLDIQVIHCSPQYITCHAKSYDGKLDCLITSVYGYSQTEKRKELWSDLNQFSQSIGQSPWILCGDFNALISDDEKLGGAILSDADTMDFKLFIDNCHLSHMKTLGSFFTWSNKQGPDTRIWSRLDRALINDTWIARYNSSHAEFLLPSFSDHYPALISIYEDNVQGKKSFKFFKMWTKHPSFLPTVYSIWQTSVPGHLMYSVCAKLKLLKSALKELNKKHYHNISEQVMRAKNALEAIQRDLQQDPLNPIFIKQERDSLVSFNKLADCELSFYKQKSRIAWNIHGDRCTKLFHSIIKSNRHYNRILVLHDNSGIIISDNEGIAMEFISYFKGLMGTAVNTDSPDYNIIKNGPCINDTHSRYLSAHVSNEEIKKAVFSMSDNKAPGPDGYSASFYKSAWPIIGEEVTLAVEEFFKTGKLLGVTNSTAIVLIPKVQCPSSPSDFRPISCCNCIYKIISKILANRMQTVMGYIINDAQCAFVKGRSISSNVLLAHELVKNYGRRHISPRIMINIDIRKAFNTISWKFLSEMLVGLGFPISSPKYSISLNGSLHGFFKGERGLRQGDPLSPYLFILGMEYLSRSLDLLKHDKKFKYHPKCAKLKISHLIFADDLLLFSKGDLYSVQQINQKISHFSAVTGLDANPSKSSIFYGGVNNIVKASIQSCLGFSEGSLPIR
ncbi:uncharacterized protein LOC109841898 [Asparagus officinalis]|uniref:uncharacterized protein LOC109841898 n=1 Tax=Asparagus officinalis TaxID=4686 RepID=UPI00098E230A|nr:uncharacterized protein LOC109841898 [Asparagus officinalis]